MPTFTLLPAEETYIAINGIRLGRVQSYEVRSEIEIIPAKGIGETQAAALGRGAVRHTVKLRRLRADSTLSDGLELDKLKNFTLEIFHGGHSTAYSGCQWTSIAEGLQGDGRVWEEYTLQAAQRTEDTQEQEDVENAV